MSCKLQFRHDQRKRSFVGTLFVYPNCWNASLFTRLTIAVFNTLFVTVPEHAENMGTPIVVSNTSRFFGPILKVLCSFTILCTFIVPVYTSEYGNACGASGVCKCFNKPTRSFVVDCSHRHLEEVPRNIPNNVTELLLSWNRISEIQSIALENMTFLRQLNLSCNRLEKLPYGIFGKIQYLKILDLQKNHLSYLPRDLFENNTELEILYLLKNRLKKLPTDLFRRNTKIKTISLSNNHLDDLPTDIFGKARELIKIKLSYNWLKVIREDTFVNNTKLTELKLSDNDLEELPEGLFWKNPMLTFLKLSNNHFNSLPERLFEKNHKMEFLDLSNNPLKTLPRGILAGNCELYKLLLKNIQLDELPDGIFQNCYKLRIVHSVCTFFVTRDLSYNKLTTLPGSTFASSGFLEKITITNNHLTLLSDGIFHRNGNLRMLDLSINPLKRLSKGLFARNNNVIRIVLRKTQLEELPEDIFQNCTKLKEIVLSHNKLTEVPENIFRRNSMLQSVAISNNSLVTIPANVFANNSKLLVLAISNNSLLNIPPAIFANNVYLKKVTISHNKLTEVPENTFMNNTLLESVVISNNKLKSIPHNLFANSIKVKSILLSANNLTTLPNGLFESTRSLQRLHLCFNEINSLPENLFSAMRGLQQLTICRNSLSNVTNRMFRGLVNLQYISLYGNRLSSLSKDLFNNVSLDGVVDISYNYIWEIPEGLFDSNQRRFHKLTWLLLNNNKLVYLRKNTFKGLPMLTHIFLHGNQISSLGDDVFAGTNVQFVYMFSNSLLEIRNKTFYNGVLRELQVYRNGMKTFTANAFYSRSSHIHVFLQCYDLIELPLLNERLQATCVTDGILPKIKIPYIFGEALQANLMDGGFHCSFNKGMSECYPCPPGTYGYGRYGCQPCPAGGFYQDDVGRLDCSICKEGTFVNHTRGNSSNDCELCPEGTDLEKVAGHRACFCKVGYGRTHRFQGCSLCLEPGLNCSQDFKSLKPGYYWNWTFQGANSKEYSNFVFYLQNDSLRYKDTDIRYSLRIPKVHKCPQPSNCENEDSYLAEGIEGRCRNGYRGWLCSKCRKKFYSVLSSCLPCPNKIWIIVEVLAVLVVGVGVYLLISWQNKKQKENKLSERSILDKISSQMKIVLGFYQVVGELFESFHDVTWVGPLQIFGQIITFLKLNILRIVIVPHCYSDKLYIDVKSQFIIGLSFPVALLLVFTSLYCSWKFYSTIRKRHYIINHVAKLKRFKERLLTIALLLIFVTYPPTCDVIFRLYPGACKTFYIYDNDTSVNITLLRSDFDLNCETLTIYHRLAYIATVFYVVLLPSVFLLLLRLHCKKESISMLNEGSFGDNVEPDNEEDITGDDDESTTDTVNLNNEILIGRSSIYRDNHDPPQIPIWIKFLCENYKAEFWYWEIIELARKVIQTVLVTLLGWEDALTKLITIGTSVMFLTLHTKLSPMKSHFEQRLQMFSLTAIFLNVLIASVPIPQNYQAALSTILIVMNMVVIVVIAGEVLVYIIRAFKDKFHH